MNKDEKWMKLAILEANKAKNKGEIPVGSVIIKDEMLISRGYNQPILTNDPTAHAEIQAIRKAGDKLKNYRLVGTTLYVTLEPCSMCLGALVHARVERVVFGAYRDKTISPKLLYFDKKSNHNVDIIGGVLEDKCKQLIELFFKTRR